jgi:hypothetical protein
MPSIGLVGRFECLPRQPVESTVVKDVTRVVMKASILLPGQKSVRTFIREEALLAA